jgi:hypothetical protein
VGNQRRYRSFYSKKIDTHLGRKYQFFGPMKELLSIFHKTNSTALISLHVCINGKGLKYNKKKYKNQYQVEMTENIYQFEVIDNSEEYWLRILQKMLNFF